jgi:hypothetical protein
MLTACGVALVSLVLYLVRRRIVRRRTVTPAWLVDSQRRKWAEGVDGVSWKWPIE